jgi:hypothetical protein
MIDAAFPRCGGLQLMFPTGHLVPPGHDAWVAGGEPYVSVHFLSVDGYVA